MSMVFLLEPKVLIVATGLLLVIQQIKLSQDQAPQGQSSIKQPASPQIMGSIRQVRVPKMGWQVFHSFKQEEMLCSRSNHGCVNPDPLPVRNILTSQMCNTENRQLSFMGCWRDCILTTRYIVWLLIYSVRQYSGYVKQLCSSTSSQLYPTRYEHVKFKRLLSVIRRTAIYETLAAAHIWGGVPWFSWTTP